MSDLRRRLQALWFRPAFSPQLWLLLPLEGIFAALAALRRLAFKTGLLSAEAVGRPVVVVGNLSVGGTGKTPLVIWLAKRLQAAGRHPGIISRGYGGRGAVRPARPDGDPVEVGDEPLLLARRTSAPVFVGRDRVAAARALIAAFPEVDVIISDDGLQHYRLKRSVEIAVIDGRGFGNGHLLPAGPMREPKRLLRRLDATVIHGRGARQIPLGSRSVFEMALRPDRFVSLADPERRCDARQLSGRRLFAVAGIGDPSRFFSTLAELGLEFTERPFPDHHDFSAADLDFARGGALLMTEKDAVKCRGLFAGEAWFLPVSASIEPDLAALVLEKLDGSQTA